MYITIYYILFCGDLIPTAFGPVDKLCHHLLLHKFRKYNTKSLEGLEGLEHVLHYTQIFNQL